MTQEIFIIAAVGGLAAALGLILFAALSVAVYATVARAVTAHEAYCERRRHLATCRAIDALGTTNEPQE